MQSLEGHFKAKYYRRELYGREEVKSSGSLVCVMNRRGSHLSPGASLFQQMIQKEESKMLPALQQKMLPARSSGPALEQKLTKNRKMEELSKCIELVR